MSTALGLKKILSRCEGISLLEGVVVACLFGMAAAFAIPSFTHLSNSARASEVIALSTSLRRGADVAHVQYLASGAKLAAATLEGRTVTLKNGYPDSSTAGIRNAIFDADGFTVKTGDSFVIFTRYDAPSRDQCSVQYNAALGSSSPATVTNVDTSGC